MAWRGKQTSARFRVKNAINSGNFGNCSLFCATPLDRLTAGSDNGVSSVGVPRKTMNRSVDDYEKKPIHVSYPVFKESILGLPVRFGGIPRQINKEIFDEASPTAQGLVVSALKRLQLITPSGQATQDLVYLASSTRDGEWEENLRELLTKYYQKELKILSSGTKDELAESLASGYKGSTLRKAVRFFLMAAIDAGFAVGKQHRVKQSANQTDPILSAAAKETVSKMKRSKSSSNAQTNQDTWMVTLGDDNCQAGTILIPRVVDLDDPDLVHALLEVARLYSAKTKGGQ